MLKIDYPLDLKNKQIKPISENQKDLTSGSSIINIDNLDVVNDVEIIDAITAAQIKSTGTVTTGSGTTSSTLSGTLASSSSATGSTSSSSGGSSGGGSGY